MIQWHEYDKFLKRIVLSEKITPEAFCEIQNLIQEILIEEGKWY